MNFELQRVPADGYWSNYWLKAPFHVGHINPRPTPDTLFSLLYASDAPWNESGFRNEKFDSMLVEARGELDFARRKEIYDEMQVMVSNEAGTAIPLWMSIMALIAAARNVARTRRRQGTRQQEQVPCLRPDGTGNAPVALRSAMAV